METPARTQHDTRLLETAVNAAASRIETPATQVREASERLTTKTNSEAEARIRSAEAQARRMTLLAEARKLFVVVSALALLVLAIGLAGRLILTALPDTLADADATVEPQPATAPAEPGPSFPPEWPGTTRGGDEPPSSRDPEVITTNFTLFREKTVDLGARKFDVTAGHTFLSESDVTYSDAWCYTELIVDGLVLKIVLSTRIPGQPPKQAFNPPATLSRAGLTASDVKILAAECPWLNGNPNIDSKSNVLPDSPAAAVFDFVDEVTSDSVDRLISAVEHGAREVRFSSPGGELEAAIRGFYALKGAGIRTVASGECASACTLLFLAGTTREVAAGGRIGVHQWRSQTGTTPETDAQFLSAILLKLITDAGVSQEFYIAGAQTPPNQVRILTRSELNGWNVIRGG